MDVPIFSRARTLRAPLVLAVAMLLPIGCGSEDDGQETAQDPVDTAPGTQPSTPQVTQPTAMQPTPTGAQPGATQPSAPPPVVQPAQPPMMDAPPPTTQVPSSSQPPQASPVVPKLDCSNATSGIICNDGTRCNGEERCAPSDPSADADGCVRGMAVACGAGTTCNEATGQCSACSTVSDLDGDGHSSTTCGGDDCDDAAPERHPGRPELCDGIDNDCSGVVDDAASASCTAPAGGSASCVDARCTTQCSVPGYVHDGVACVPPGSCAGVTCEHGSCVATLTSYECRCSEGFTGSGTKACTDIDECATNLSGCEQQCVNSVGSYRCTCGAGYMLAANGKSCALAPPVGNACDNVTACAPGDCVPQGATYACSCPEGFADMGGSCADVDECASNLGGCSHGCENRFGYSLCTCPAGMTLGEDRLTCQGFRWTDPVSLTWGGVPFNLQVAMNDSGKAVVSWDQADVNIGVGGWAAPSYYDASSSRFVWEASQRFAGGWADGSIDYYSSSMLDDAGTVVALWTNRLEGAGYALWTREKEYDWGYHTWALSVRGASAPYGGEGTLFGDHGRNIGAYWERDGAMQVRFRSASSFSTWSEAETVSLRTPGSTGFWQSATMDAKGVSTMVWGEAFDGAPGTFLFSRRENGVWSAPASVDPGFTAEGQYAPAVVADRAGGTHVLWRRGGLIHHTQVGVGGTTGAVDLPSTDGSLVDGPSLPLRAAAGNFNVAAVWGEPRSDGLGVSLRASAWAPSGQWMAPFYVGVSWQNFTAADIVMDASGRTLIAYIADGELWVTSLHIDTATIDAGIRLDDGRAPVTQLRMAMDASGRAVIAWMLDSDSTRIMARRLE